MNTQRKDENTIPGKVLKEKLRLKTDRTMEVYLKEGALPQPVKELEDGDLLFDKQQVLEMLGAKSLEENFINAQEVSEILDTSISQVTDLARKGFIPNYRLKNVKGSHILYLASEVEAAKQFTIMWTAPFANRVGKEKAIKDILSKLTSEQIGFLTERRSLVFREILISGKSLPDIAEKLGLTSTRVKMIFEQAVESLISRLDAINEFFEKDRQRHLELTELRKKLNYYEEQEKKAGLLSFDQKELLTKSINEFDFSMRILNTFRAADINTVSDLVRHTKQDLCRYRNCGKKSTTEVEKFLTSKGLSLGMDI